MLNTLVIIDKDGAIKAIAKDHSWHLSSHGFNGNYTLALLEHNGKAREVEFLKVHSDEIGMVYVVDIPEKLKRDKKYIQLLEKTVRRLIEEAIKEGVVKPFPEYLILLDTGLRLMAIMSPVKVPIDFLPPGSRVIKEWRVVSVDKSPLREANSVIESLPGHADDEDLIDMIEIHISKWIEEILK